MGALNPLQGVKFVALAPGEPASYLGGVQLMSVPGVAGEVGDRGQLGRGHLARLEG